jgi:hypothetical protein
VAEVESRSIADDCNLEKSVTATRENFAIWLRCSAQSSQRRILWNSRAVVNLCRSAKTSLWAGILTNHQLESSIMPKAARISVKVPASSVSSLNSDSSQFATIALFSGIGLLISLIAILMGVQGTWY